MKRVIIGLICSTTLLFGWGERVDYNNYTNQPKYGVEINPFRLITMGSAWSSVSGTFSIFDYVNNAEIAFPILYSIEEDDDYNYDQIGESKSDSDFKVFTLDVHYRKFMNNRVGGMYISTLARVASLEGRLRDFKIDDSGKNYAKVTKFGVGVGIGYRFLPQASKWYWGAGLIAGRYLGSDNNIFESSSLSGTIDDSAIFFDIELLKVGYRF